MTDSKEEVDKILNWVARWKMSVNSDKTKAMIIATSGTDTRWDPELKTPQGEINTVSQYKFLGVTVDNGLRFTQHIENTVRKCKKRVNILKCIAWKG